MNTISITLSGLLAMASALPALGSAPLAIQGGPHDAGQGVHREAVTPYPNHLSPRLHAALLRVLEAEEEFTLLTHPFDEAGNEISQAEKQWRMTAPESPLKQYLDHHRPRFDTRGLAMDRLALRDCILYDAAFGAAAELVDEHPDFEIDELLAAFEASFVEGVPIWSTELAREHHVRSLDAHEFWPLGNGRALGRLTWGLLQQDSFWRGESRDRGLMILGLLERGAESRLVAQVVDLSLANALPTSTDPAKDGHGVCGPEFSIAQSIGYDRRHEQALVRDLELITYLSSLQDYSGPFNLDLVTIEELPHGALEVTPTALGHLRWWVPAKLDQVRNELYDGAHLEQLHMEMRRSKSLEERLLFWGKLAKQTDFATFRVHVLEELSAVLAWEVDFPGTERLQELMDLAEAGTLSDDQLAELSSLEGHAKREQDRFMQALINGLIGVGIDHEIDFLVSTIADDLPAALELLGKDGFAGAQRHEALMSEAWFQLASSESPELNRLLSDGLTHPASLPVLARDNLIWAATQDAGMLAVANLERVLDIGSPRDKAIALLNPGWAREDTYTVAMTDLLDQVYAMDAGRSTRLRIEAYFTSSLTNRPVSAGTREVLLASLRDANWASKSESCYWSQVWEAPERFPDRLALVRRYLTPQEIEAKVAEGLLPTGVF